jgi:serine phosphatase RsbU (regulator of sigma subunit)
MLRRLAFIFILQFIFSGASAQLFSTDLQKGLKAFDNNNFDKAKEIFNEIIAKDSSDAGAHYGMAEIYFSRNFLGYSVTSAYKYISQARDAYSQQTKKQLAALSKAGVDQQKISSLAQKIDDELFSITVSKNTPQDYDEFIRLYPNNPNVSQARELKEQLSFYNASSGNSEEAMNNFIQSNPKGKGVEQAVRLRNLVAFQKAKATNTVKALEDFIAKYPDAAEVTDAKIALGTLRFDEAKKTNTVEAYDKFLSEFPEAEEFHEATTLRNQLAYIQLLEQQKAKDNAVIQKSVETAEAQQFRINISIALFIVTLLGAVLLYRGYKIKKRSNIEITHQKEIIEQKNREIVDSINYAQRIQQSLLPSIEEIRKSLPEAFVFYQPRNIVSGDFYWFAQQDNRYYIAAVDCTGHGVPGAMLSMIGFNFLNQLVSEMNMTDPGKILDQLHARISQTLNKEGAVEGREMRDGMDMALLCIDKSANTFSFSGAVRPLYYVDEDGIKTIKGGYYSIGGIKSLTDEPFETYTVTPKGKANFYLFSDGFADQFGGPKGKKFKTKKFQELLLSLQDKQMHEQHNHIENVFREWMGNFEQVDDVCVIGIRV